MKINLNELNFRIGTPFKYRHRGNSEPFRLFQAAERIEYLSLESRCCCLEFRDA
jgi:hypothetical protein